jgi:hypothetical protein
MELLARCLTAWELVDRALRQAAQLARLDLSAATPLPSTGEGGPSGPGEGPAVQIAACRDVLGRIQRAMQVGDFVDVADRVEHELPGLTDGWQTLLVQLQQSLLAGRKSLEAPAPEC